MQSLIKILLTFNLIKTNKKNIFKLLNAIKKFANKIIIKIVKQYLLFAFFNFMRLKNYTHIRKILRNSWRKNFTCSRNIFEAYIFSITLILYILLSFLNLFLYYLFFSISSTIKDVLLAKISSLIVFFSRYYTNNSFYTLVVALSFR